MKFDNNALKEEDLVVKGKDMRAFKLPEYTCEKHGDIGNEVMSFNLNERDPKIFCLCCLEEAMSKVWN